MSDILKRLLPRTSIGQNLKPKIHEEGLKGGCSPSQKVHDPTGGSTNPDISTVVRGQRETVMKRNRAYKFHGLADRNRAFVPARDRNYRYIQRKFAFRDTKLMRFSPNHEGFTCKLSYPALLKHVRRPIDRFTDRYYRVSAQPLPLLPCYDRYHTRHGCRGVDRNGAFRHWRARETA